MKKLNKLQKAVLDNVLNNFKREVNDWIDRKIDITYEPILLFIWEKTGVKTITIPEGDKAIDLSVEFDMYIDKLISGDIKDDKGISFMLYYQDRLSRIISPKVIEYAELGFPEYRG